MANQWIFFIVGIFYVIPFIALLRYFWVFRTREYLFTSLVFLSLVLNGVVIVMMGLGSIFDLITVISAFFLLVFVTKRTLSRKYSRFYNLIVGLLVILTIVNLALYNTSSTLHIIRVVSFELMRLLLGIYIYFAYSNIELVVNNRRTNLVRNIWRTAGIIAMASSVIRIVDIIRVVVTLPSIYTTNIPELSFSLGVISIGALILSLLTGIVAVGFPELFLLSRVQIENLYELYSLSELMNKNTSLPIPKFSFLEYLREVEKNLPEKP